MTSSLWLMCLQLSLPAAGDFEVVRTEKDGMVLSSRAARDTDFKELRVQARSNATPAQLADIIWSGRARERSEYLSHRECVSDTPTVRVERQVLSLPVLGQRDSLVRFERLEEPGGTIVIRYALGGKPTAARAEVMKLLRGEWRLIPRAAGGTDIDFRALSDPGGVSALLASGPQRNAVVNAVRDVLKYAAAGKATGQRTQPKPGPVTRPG